MQTLPGSKVGAGRISSKRLYRLLLGKLMSDDGQQGGGFGSYWTTRPVRYTRDGDGHLRPVPVNNDPTTTWVDSNQGSGFAAVPPDLADVAFRAVSPHAGQGATAHGVSSAVTVTPTAVGEFDPVRLIPNRALNRVPLETYQPPSAAPLGPSSIRALQGRALTPTNGFAGYLSEPPTMITTLTAARALLSHDNFFPTSQRAPIGAIRVRVSGVTGADPVSIARIDAVANRIHQATGLVVDVTAGSSPAPVTVDLPAGHFDRPALTLREGWTNKGVALRILTAIDRKSLALLALLLAVCGVFVANAAAASVRTRVRELGTLACLGWRPRELFRAVAGELAITGLMGAAVGVMIAFPLAADAGTHPSHLLAGLSVPIVVALALVAGLAPAWRAARTPPAVAVRPAIRAPGSPSEPRGLLGMATANLRRRPARSFSGVLALAVGVGAVTLVTAIITAFRGSVVGSLLGTVVQVNVTGLDLLGIAVIAVLGLASLIDIVYLGLRERAVELATLSATGWRDQTLARLVIVEAVVLAAIGSIIGAALGLAGAIALGASLGAAGPVAAVTIACATVIAMLASLIPAMSVRRMLVPALLAEE
ncbi:MAG TPA: FtsX-like permease family protein [Nocardioidaceae bacterium]|nr:FtsX-like permease family protein [Nocardioidaceae bacterium]